MSMSAETMNVQEAAAFLRLHPETVKKNAREGLLPAAKVGRKWLFLRADLEKWLRAGGVEYEAAVDRGLATMAEERAKDAVWVSEDEMKARLGL